MGHERRESSTPRMVGIVGASGAINALPTILSDSHMFPPADPCPESVCRGTSSTNSSLVWPRRAGYRWSWPRTRAQCLEAGKVYVAGTDFRLLLDRDAPISPEREPGVDDTMATLFRSMALELGTGAVGVILSGAGREGLQRGDEGSPRRGSDTRLPRDERASLAYGMARWAVEAGAICESLPIQEIAPRLAALATQGGQ